MKRGTSNPVKEKLIKNLTKSKAGIWIRVAELLSRAGRKTKSVNLWKLERYAKENIVIIVPTKVLGVGEFTKKNMVAASSFSESAKKKLGKQAITIKQAFEKDKEGKNIQVMA